MKSSPYTFEENILFNQEMIKITDFCVIITVSLLQLIYIHWGRENSQHSMLDNTDNNNISIENYYQEILQKFMVSLCVFITF